MSNGYVGVTDGSTMEEGERGMPRYLRKVLVLDWW